MAEENVGAHPVWACDNEAIKDEYRRVCDDRDKYLSWFQRADGEIERLTQGLERIAAAWCLNNDTGDEPECPELGIELCITC